MILDHHDFHAHLRSSHRTSRRSPATASGLTRIHHVHACTRLPPGSQRSLALKFAARLATMTQKIGSGMQMFMMVGLHIFSISIFSLLSLAVL